MRIRGPVLLIVASLSLAYPAFPSAAAPPAPPTPFTGAGAVVQKSVQKAVEKTAEGLAKVLAVTPALSLRVLNYNIKGLPGFAAPGFDEDRYADIGRILADRQAAGNGPDLVLLQESFVSRTAELRAIAKFPFSAKGPDAATLWGVDSGLWILSRYPILKEERRSFGKLCASWDCYSNKGVQMARIQVPGAPFPLEVYNTHMQASRRSDAIRKRQVKVILEFIRDTHQAGVPMIFGGDFNFRPGAKDNSFADFLAGTALVHAGKLCRDSGCPAVPGFDPDRLYASSVDHQFISEGEAFRLLPRRAERNFLAPVKGRALSDHLGYEVQYELSWPAESRRPASAAQK